MFFYRWFLLQVRNLVLITIIGEIQMRRNEVAEPLKVWIRLICVSVFAIQKVVVCYGFCDEIYLIRR